MAKGKATVCGQQFDVVEEGLAEAQVAAWLIDLKGQMKAISERRDPLTELCRTCEQIAEVLHDTKTALQGAREAAFKAVEQEKGRVLRDAYAKAQEAEAQAQQSAQAIKREAHEALAMSRAEAESILANARKQASELVAMSSESASTALLEAGERIQSELIFKLRAQAEEALAARVKADGPPNGNTLVKGPAR